MQSRSRRTASQMEPCMKAAQRDPWADAAGATINASDAPCCRKKKAKDHGRRAERLWPDAADQDRERERLKRHRRDQMAGGRVWIPETWGQEEALLRDWAADCTAFDRSLFPKGLRTAKEALVEECTRAKLRIGNRC